MGGKMYGVIAPAFAIAGLWTAFIQRWLVPEIGYFAIFIFLSWCSVVSLVLVVFVFKEESKWVDYEPINDKEKDVRDVMSINT